LDERYRYNQKPIDITIDIEDKKVEIL